MAAIAAANMDHDRSYGADRITERVTELFRNVFGSIADVLFVFNGTGANVLSIAAATRSGDAVLCADTSHIYNDEAAAPETFTSCRYFPLKTDDSGKVLPEALAERIIRKGDVHYAQPKLLSLTQSTEYGSVYSPTELTALTKIAHDNGLYIHLDGSRLFNAAAAQNASLRANTLDCGIDILSLGGTKLGMMFGEAVVVFNPALAERIRFQQKQVMQLHSKTRFIAAQYEALLGDELWRDVAGHANRMAGRLAAGLMAFAQVTITRPVQANAVFAEIPQSWNEPLMADYPFYVWKEDRNEVRLMCAWDTKPEWIDAFIEKCRELSGLQ